MTNVTLQLHDQRVNGELVIPGDKSISHRAIMLGALASGTTNVSNFLDGDDCLNTASIFRALGVTIDIDGTDVRIESEGQSAWQTPSGPLYAGNSGTTARLLLGLLAGSTVEATITGDRYLSKRPMDRIVEPLRDMGADITSEEEALVLPIHVKGGTLEPFEYAPPVASAQVKSAILFAGLGADGTTTVHEQSKTRDHTERMMEQFGVTLREEGLSVSIEGGQTLQATDVVVPGDISSAAFFLAAGAIKEGSDLLLKRVGLNETRTGMLDVMRDMGADVTIEREVREKGEPYGDLRIRYAPLRGVDISSEALMPRLIDELPIIALLATQADGVTTIRNAEELRVKETDRITAVVSQLNALGASIEELPDGMKITGPTPLRGGSIDSYGDHRLGMMGAIASLVAKEPVTVVDTDCITISYPEFFKHLEKVTATSVQ